MNFEDLVYVTGPFLRIPLDFYWNLFCVFILLLSTFRHYYGYYGYEFVLCVYFAIIHILLLSTFRHYYGYYEYGLGRIELLLYGA